MTEGTMKPRLEHPDKPRILLVEDDPVSQLFFSIVLESLPARVETAASCASARQSCADGPGHALWLIDANLPDGSGVELLAALRVAAPDTVAVAHTASQQHEDLDALVAGGFSQVLVKPLTAQALLCAVRGALGDAATTVSDPPARYALLPDWDDSAARRALNGQDAHVATLRGLFLDELPSQRRTIATALAAGETARALLELHRLRASCGFVGAAKLQVAVQALEREPGDAEALQSFEAAASQLLAKP